MSFYLFFSFCNLFFINFFPDFPPYLLFLISLLFTFLLFCIGSSSFPFLPPQFRFFPTLLFLLLYFLSLLPSSSSYSHPFLLFSSSLLHLTEFDSSFLLSVLLTIIHFFFYFQSALLSSFTSFPFLYSSYLPFQHCISSLFILIHLASFFLASLLSILPLFPCNHHYFHSLFPWPSFSSSLLPSIAPSVVLIRLLIFHFHLIYPRLFCFLR